MHFNLPGFVLTVAVAVAVGAALAVMVGAALAVVVGAALAVTVAVDVNVDGDVALVVGVVVSGFASGRHAAIPVARAAIQRARRPSISM